MQEKIENFVRYSIRYQILLAQHVAKICNKNIYVFNSDGYFKKDVFVETIDGVRTLFKNGHRAVLSIAVEESFGTDEHLFLRFADKDIVQKDELGLYVVIPIEQIQVRDTLIKIEEEAEKEVDLKEIVEEAEKEAEKEAGEDAGKDAGEKAEKEVDLKEIVEAVEQLEAVL